MFEELAPIYMIFNYAYSLPRIHCCSVNTYSLTKEKKAVREIF